MPATPENIETARKLFEEGGWSSGDAYGPDEWFSDDAVMRDIVNHDGTLRGKDEIREFWVKGRVGLTLRVPVEETYIAKITMVSPYSGWHTAKLWKRMMRTMGNGVVLKGCLDSNSMKKER